MSIKALYVMGGNRAGEKLVASTSCGEMTPALSESGFTRSATSLCVTTTQSNPPENPNWYFIVCIIQYVNYYDICQKHEIYIHIRIFHIFSHLQNALFNVM